MKPWHVDKKKKKVHDRSRQKRWQAELIFIALVEWVWQSESDWVDLLHVNTANKSVANAQEREEQELSRRGKDFKHCRTTE